MFLTPLPLLPPRKVRLNLAYIIFALPAMNGQLPAELKFRENTDHFSRPPLDLPFTFMPSISKAQSANLKKCQFYSLPFGQAVASIY